MRRDAERNRRRILDAAAEVFGDRGVVGSTEEVARQAGVGIATVFRHFPTKEALVEEALLRHFADVQEQAVALADDPDPGHALHALLTTMISTGGNKLTLAGVLGDPSDPPPRVLEAAQSLRVPVATVLERAQSAGVADPAITVDDLYFLLGGLAQAAASSRPRPPTVSRSVDVLWRGLAPPP
jgi:AcrR family transcriptional regulator